MIRITLFFLLALVLCAAANAAPLVNGGFESGDLSPWLESNDAIVDFSVTTSNPHSGNYCAVGVAGVQAPYIAGLYQDDWTLLPNTEYTFSCWYRTEGADWAYSWGSSFGQIEVWEKDSAGNIIGGSVAQIVYTPTPEWTNVTTTFTTLSDTASGRILNNFQLFVPASNGANKIFLDDFNVTLVPEPASLACLAFGCAFAGLCRRRK